MTDNKKRLAPTLNEQTPSELQIFSFSENKTTIRNLMINDVPHFVATDVALALGYANPRDAIRQHCKGVVKYDILTNGGKQSMNVIPEGDVYRLIINSHLPSAQKFERWLMEEVLPSIRKNGFYKLQKPKNDFIDARSVSFSTERINNYNTRVIFINQKLYSVFDLNRAIKTSTSVGQTIKKLNAERIHAFKVWVFVATNPDWFATDLGKNLIMNGSRIERNRVQLALPFQTKGGNNG